MQKTLQKKFAQKQLGKKIWQLDGTKDRKLDPKIARRDEAQIEILMPGKIRDDGRSRTRSYKQNSALNSTLCWNSTNHISHVTFIKAL